MKHVIVILDLLPAIALKQFVTTEIHQIHWFVLDMARAQIQKPVYANPIMLELIANYLYVLE